VSGAQFPLALVIAMAQTWEELGGLLEPEYKYRERKKEWLKYSLCIPLIKYKGIYKCGYTDFMIQVDPDEPHTVGSVQPFTWGWKQIHLRF
jgi:hypothetical protein